VTETPGVYGVRKASTATDKQQARADLNGHGVNGESLLLPRARCLEMYRIMVRTRAMEERMIKMSKSGEGYFWIGGPGEEAFNTALGLQVKKGEGPDFDYLHLHYRNSATMVAMGMPLIDGIRQMAMTATDPFSMGRNFPSHYSHKPWNVIPVSSVIEIQFAMAPGTALVQKRHGGDGITIVVGGESGSAEGDFATCMIWSTRPGNELPVLMIVMNNGFGISTSYGSQQAAKSVIERGQPFGIPGESVDGNDPIASWFAVEKALHHCRTTRRPYLLEARVARLYGHSSSSGAPRSHEADCIGLFEIQLMAARWLDQATRDQVHAEAKAEAEEAVAEAMMDAKPQAEDVEKHTYAASPVDKVYPGDYSGLPPA
jgi:2-oxoisovalerate dehydrogenase E1 component alpha subunit